MVDAAQNVLDDSAPELVSLGYAEDGLYEPEKALGAFDRAVASLPAKPATTGESAFFANAAHGRSRAWTMLGDLKRAVSYEEETVKLRPERSEDWLDLANLYERQQRFEDSRRARQRAAAIRQGQQP
jgi:tetratricopeptide (TPR) repeat protein